MSKGKIKKSYTEFENSLTEADLVVLSSFTDLAGWILTRQNNTRIFTCRT